MPIAAAKMQRRYPRRGQKRWGNNSRIFKVRTEWLLFDFEQPHLYWRTRYLRSALTISGSRPSFCVASRPFTGFFSKAKANGSIDATVWLDDVKKRKPASSSIRKLEA